MTTLCKLQREKAVSILLDNFDKEHFAFVKYRSGVWNKYETVPLRQAIQSIRNSLYGSDVYKDEKGVYYVSCPCQSDMW